MDFMRRLSASNSTRTCSNSAMFIASPNAHDVLRLGVGFRETRLLNHIPLTTLKWPWIATLLVLLSLAACTATERTSTPNPTVDVDATVEARVQAIIVEQPISTSVLPSKVSTQAQDAIL